MPYQAPILPNKNDLIEDLNSSPQETLPETIIFPIKEKKTNSKDNFLVKLEEKVAFVQEKAILADKIKELEEKNQELEKLLKEVSEKEIKTEQIIVKEQIEVIFFCSCY